MLAIATLNLACKLHDDLLVPRELRRNGHQDSFVVKGGVRLKGASARCSFLVSRGWIRHSPDVICHEPWLRKVSDWHAYADGHLCYVYELEWQDEVKYLAEHDGFLVAADAARLWILRNVTWLLSKHLLSDELGLTHWPKDWPYWPHGIDEAKRKYKQRR